jgi:hypothetical protein
MLKISTDTPWQVNVPYVIIGDENDSRDFPVYVTLTYT